jgi:hypothetical protein
MQRLELKGGMSLLKMIRIDGKQTEECVNSTGMLGKRMLGERLERQVGPCHESHKKNLGFRS